jgi:hypothetical protein
MSIEAMKQALKFCEEIGDLRGPYPFVNETQIVSDSRKVLKALRQAIAEAEKQEPVGYVSESGKGAYLLVGVDLEDDTPLYAAPVHASDEFKEMVEKGTKAWADIPDDWVADLRGGIESCTKVGTKSGVLPTEWVGLDPETMRNTTLEFNRGALWAERYLKEKNT